MLTQLPKTFGPSALHLASLLVNELAEKTLEPKPMAVVQEGVALLASAGGMPGSEKKKVLIAALEMIARGADGVSGTEDDAIPRFFVVTGLSALIESDLLGDVIEAAYVAYTKGDWRKRLPRCLKCLKSPGR
jgi:hypothetical protein